MREEFSRRTFLGSLTALGISTLVSRSTAAAPPEVELGVWLDNHPSIANAIVWENVARGVATPVPFRGWSQLQKQTLAEVFKLQLD